MRSGVALAALAVGCSTGVGRDGNLPPAPTIVQVVEQDHGYVLDRTEVPAGRTVFQLANRSRLAHDLSLVVIPEDMPPIGEQLKGSNRRVVPNLATLPSRPVGSHDAFAVDLTPGRYGLVCWEHDGTGVAHALMGMAVELRVVPSRGQQGSQQRAPE